MESNNLVDNFAAFGFLFSIIVFFITIVLIFAIISIANSNVRIRKGIENIYTEIYKTNVVNNVHEKWEILESRQLEEQERLKAENRATRKGWFS